MTETLLIGLIYVISAVAQGMVGFGFAVLSVPLVSLVYDPTTAVTMNLIVGASTFVYKAFLLRSRTNYRRVFRFLGVAICFVPIGVFLMTALPRNAILIAMGLFIVSVGIVNILALPTINRAMNSRCSYFFLASLAGVLSGAFSAPGPAAVPYLLTVETDPIVGQANLQWFFVLLYPVIAILYFAYSSFDHNVAWRALYYVPLTFVITLICNTIAVRIPVATLKKITNTTLIFIGSVLFINNLLNII